MEQVVFKDLEVIDYQKAWDFQTQVHRELVSLKLENRKREKEGTPLLHPIHQLLFCEHPPVYTLGKSGSLDHLLLNEIELAEQGFQFYKINRGGDITYHGPGQLVGYPIFDLEYFFRDVHKYVRYIEEVIIRTIAEYGLLGKRISGYTGVWLAADEWKPNRKICAIGVHLSRWVTMHGFAFNINSQLEHFQHIIPCGIDDKDKAVTSLAEELGREIDMEDLKLRVKKHFAALFDYAYVDSRNA